MSGATSESLPLGQIIVGDVRTVLPTLPASSVDTIITSPPYFKLRDYQHPDQLGLEANVDAWVESIVAVCDELARVLRPGGSLWLNVADSYSSHVSQGAPKKALLLGPQRLALALSKHGWLLRNHVVWAKRNFMPSSVGDRLTNGHEVLLFCVRSPRYYFDLDAIRVPHGGAQKPHPNSVGYQYLPDEAVPAGGVVDLNLGLNKLKAKGLVGHPRGKNPGDVWHLPTASYRGAHFATYPIALVEPPLLATCPERTCVACGEPWRRTAGRRQRSRVQSDELRPTCDCQADWTPGVVLDPFMGSGSTAVAAEKHGRQWVGIEVNPTFATLAEQRLANWREEQKSKQHKENRP